jgi:hypothetical protein
LEEVDRLFLQAGAAAGELATRQKARVIRAQEQDSLRDFVSASQPPEEMKLGRDRIGLLQVTTRQRLNGVAHRPTRNERVHANPIPRIIHCLQQQLTVRYD